jgi:hypothetical protein
LAAGNFIFVNIYIRIIITINNIILEDIKFNILEILNILSSVQLKAININNTYVKTFIKKCGIVLLVISLPTAKFINIIEHIVKI